MQATRHVDLLAALAEAHVEFVLVGGTAAVVHGAPYTTHDVDVVYRRSEPNIEKLLGVLGALGACIDDLTGRRLPVSASLLRLPGPKLLRTRLGRLDLLGELDPDTSFDELLADSLQLDVGLGAGAIRVISLDRLIATKKRVARPRDLALVPILEALRTRLRSG